MNPFRRLFRRPVAAVSTVQPMADEPLTAKPLRISDGAIHALRGKQRPQSPFTGLPTPPPGVRPANDGPALAMDDAFSTSSGSIGAWAQGQLWGEGLFFPGYPYLAELAQRPEYRNIIETIAEEMTRKWIKITSSGTADKTAKVKTVEAGMKTFGLRAAFNRAMELDGFMGMGIVYIDTGASDDPDELKTPLVLDKAKIAKGQLKGFVPVDPMWVSPMTYNSIDPLKPDFFVPSIWYVMGKQVHASRLLIIRSREVPDILKPAYNFGGLPMSQMAKPSIDNFLRTRQSVSDLLHSFTVFVLKTNMMGYLQDAGGMTARLAAFILGRDNKGLMMVDKDQEDISNVSAPLGTLDHLQAQSQEQLASVAQIPLVKLLGVTPSGLNASSDGEVRTFYDRIRAKQEKAFSDPLTTALQIIQLSEIGSVDPDIGFEFVSLWELDEAGRAAVQKMKADTASVYMAGAVISNDEVRTQLANDPESPFHGLEGEAPEMPDDMPDSGDDPAESIGKQGAEGGSSGANAMDLAMDREHWITTEGGSHLLISGEGGEFKIIGGAGGKLNGQKVDPKSMSLPLGWNKSKEPAKPYSAPPPSESQSQNEIELPKPAVRPTSHAESEIREILGNRVSDADMRRVMDILARESGKGRIGGSHTVHTSAGTKIEARPELVDLEDLTTSNNDDGKINPAFPQHLQPRDRSTSASQAQIQALSGHLLPERLGPSPEASSGAPIVGPDGVVESGNGRTMALRRVLTDPTLAPQRERYVSWLKSQGHNVDGVKNPVLVMRRTSDMTDAQRRKFVVEANERTTLGMGAAEQARADAARAGENIEKWKGADAGAASNRDFARAFMSSMSPEERGNMMNPDGTLSAEGQRRIQSSVTAHAYGEKFGNVLDRFLSGDSDGMKAVAGAMSDVAGEWAQMRKASKDGAIPANLDITRDLSDAVETIARARQLGRPVKELLDQTDLDRAPLSQNASTILRGFFRDPDMRKPAGREAVASMLNKYAEEASKVSPEPDMFGTPPATAAQLLKTAARSTIGQDQIEELGEDAIADTVWYITHGMAGDGAGAT